jgi:RsiW-degrading membrane proteinase PrsW (M82 family)
LFVPLIEELAKPIAIWFLMWGRALTPAQGFGLGMLSGAGFALAENLFSGASITGWADTTFVRIGATAFHLATAGLMGWALVRARGQRRYLALAGIYVFNIFIHGLWNTIVVLGSVSPEATSSLPFQLPNLAGIVLVSITLLCIGIIIVMNKRMQPVIIRRSVVKKARSTAKFQR